MANLRISKCFLVLFRLFSNSYFGKRVDFILKIYFFQSQELIFNFKNLYWFTYFVKQIFYHFGLLWLFLSENENETESESATFHLLSWEALTLCCLWKHSFDLLRVIKILTHILWTLSLIEFFSFQISALSKLWTLRILSFL